MMSSGEEENDECIEHGQLDETDPVFRSVAEADVSLDEMMSLACRQGKLDIVELLLESGAHVDYRNKAGNTPLLEACSQGHVDVARYLLNHNANIDSPTETTSDSALTWACTLGNEPIVELLLEKTSNVEHRTKDGCTALMFAALAGHVKVAAMLLDHNAEINVESDSNKDSPLTFACWKGHCDVVELLLERHANIEHRTKEGFTPLMFAALGGHTDVARKLLERGAKVNVPSGSNNDIPLTSACWKGHHDVVKLLLEFTSNIEHRTKDGCTPLMLAAREGHYSVAKLILDSNAEVNVPSGSENNIPLTLACWKGHTNVVELLLEHKSNIEHRNKAGCTPLMLAAREGHVETTRLLLNKGAEINTPSGSNDDTPLTLACWKGHVEVVDLLLKQNSKVDHQTKTGCTPLMEATREGHVAVAEQLLAHGADVELPDNYGQSPLFMACWKGHRDVAELLLENVANRDCRTKTGITPLFQACRENHVDVVELLLDYGASVNAPFPNSRENPLTLAGEKGHVELVSLLLSRCANVECHTKKGCTPFHLACKEGHLEIGMQLHEKGADTEASDLRNNTPLVASMRNGHVEVVEWLLGVVNHLPSEELCQKCLVAPVDDKDKHEDMMIGRTKCYDLVTKAKKSREQKVQRNTEIFLKELEHEKEREDIRKKKAAAKRRDKRKKKKAAKDTEPQNGSQTVEDLPLENRPQEPLVDDWEHDPEECENDVVDTTRTVTDEPLIETGHKEIGTREPLTWQSLKNKQQTDNETNQLKLTTNEDITSRVVNHSKPKRPLSTGDMSTPRNAILSNERNHHRYSSSGKDSEPKNTLNQDRNLRRKSDELMKLSKKKTNPHRSERVESDKTEKFEIKTKTLSEVTQSQTVNGVKLNTNQESRGEKPATKTSSSGVSPRRSSHNKQQTGGSPSHSSSGSSKMLSPRDSNHDGTTKKNSSESFQAPFGRPKDGTEPFAIADSTTSGTDTSKTGTKGFSCGGARLVQSDGEREHKAVHSPRLRQHPQVCRGEDNWKEVTRNTNSKTVIFQLTAPNALCGRVIGRGGSKINSITEESGAQITIGKPEPKTPTDRVISIKGTSKAVQRAKFLVTQALNTPSTIGQMTPTTSTATTSNAMSSSDRTDTSTSPAPVRGNFAAIPSSPAEWPTIEQANNMAVQTQPPKTALLNKDGKPRDEMKSSPELSEGSQETFEQGVGVMTGKDDHLTVVSAEEALTSASTSPVSSDPAWSSTSTAWKPYCQSPQSMGVSTSAVTTSVSSSMSVFNSNDSKRKMALVKPSGSNVPLAYAPFPAQSVSAVQVLTQSQHRGMENKEHAPIISSQANWESKGRSLTSSSVTTVSISTSAAMTTTHRDLHITPDEPPNNLTSHVCYGAIGSNKKALQESPRSSDLPARPFGVIGEVSSTSNAFQSEPIAPEYPASQQDVPLHNRTTSGLLPSPKQQKKSRFPCFSPWASQSTGISDIGSESFSSGRQLQGPLPGMEYFTGSSSLFSSGSLSTYPWSTGENRDESAERSRSISWPGQSEYQGEHQFIPPVQEKLSPIAPKTGSETTVNLRPSELHGASGNFKPLSSGSIWGPPGNQHPPATSLSVVCDDESPEKQPWNNSDSTSSSRSSSRQELTSIMDSEVPANSGMWSSSAFVEDLTPTPQEALVGMSASLSDQGASTGSQWVPGRAAYSAPSSPSLPRTQHLPDSAPPSMGGHPSVDDLAVRPWASKQRSPRSLSSSEPSTGWTGNLPMTVRRSSVDLSQSVVGENSIPAHPWHYSRPVSQVYPPGLTMRKNWREQTAPHNNSEIMQLLQQLGLEKYLPVFEEHSIDGIRLAQMVEDDLENLGIPKGPRLKLLFAVHGTRCSGGNSFQPPGNGFVKTDPTPPIIPPSKKLTKIEQPLLVNNHNHILGEVHLSPSGHKKPSLKQVLNPPFSQPLGNHGNQHLLSLMTSAAGRAMNPAHHVGLVSQNHGNAVPPRPHSATGNINTSQAYFPVSSHGEQTLPFVTQQGPYVNHVPYTQPPQVFYPGGFYFYYPQQ